MANKTGEENPDKLMELYGKTIPTVPDSLIVTENVSEITNKGCIIK